MRKHFVDPEEERWHRKYPRFPGVRRCVELLHRRAVRGTWVDIICYELRAHARETSRELLDAFRAEPDDRVRAILLAVIAEARLSEALPLLVENLGVEDERLRFRARAGLEDLGTREARAALWQAGVHPDSPKRSGDA
jgi:hypothetical protein